MKKGGKFKSLSMVQSLENFRSCKQTSLFLPGRNTILFPTFSSLTEVEGNFRKSNEINETVVDEEACEDVDTKLEDDVESDFETPSVLISSIILD